MAYYTTDQLARRFNISPATARYYLNKGGFTARITDLRYPRHCRIYSWPSGAAAWLRTHLAARPIQPGPNPMRWLPLKEAKSILDLSSSQLNRLVRAGTLRQQRRLLSTPKGARWFSFIYLPDVHAYTPRALRVLTHHTPDTIQSHLPVFLLRAWLVLIAAEQGTACRCLALYKPTADTIQLHTEHGQQFSLPIDNPESCTEIHVSWFTHTLTAEDWTTAQSAFTAALTELSKHRKALLTIATDTINIWSGNDHSPLAEFPLPVTA